MSRLSSHFCDEDSNQTSLDEDIEDQANQASEKEIRRSNPQGKKRNQSRFFIILLDQGLFIVYKRLFLFSFTLNAAFISLAASDRFDYAKRHAALFSMANILILTLSRSEAFLRLLFSLSVATLCRLPLPLKTVATSFLQPLGGIHSGCSVSSLAWLTYALIMTIHHQDEWVDTAVDAIEGLEEGSGGGLEGEGEAAKSDDEEREKKADEGLGYSN
ncbi:hypothetical protein QJS04_geneDACA012029 [Acorus gramineus]|uniref:Uncharacterized protein n=1 Tax=Acorus gramineus TaxID=55184 RepID=A0AAV9B9Z1_ACOGR|nr:hypothetical protein QJS04_geneDACA012029 [Acorus gramineus]